MSYTADDIKTLSFKEGVRTRVQMYLGSADNEGAYQAFKEIINNATDEALAGYGNEIIIVVNEEENSIIVRDYGRGVPFRNDEHGNVLVDIYTKAHTGGKFDDKVYKNSSGLNGIGASCTCLASSWFSVDSYRNCTNAHAYFEKGELVKYEERECHVKDGTEIAFSPDPEVFKDEPIQYSYSKICSDIKNISYLYNNITFRVINDVTKETHTYCAKNGIVDFVKENNQKPLHKHIIYDFITDESGDKLEIAFQWGTSHEAPYVFVNGLRCPELGTPVTGAKTALTRTFNSLSKQNFDGDSIRNGLFYVINCTVANPSFANQTKSKINNANLRTMASTCFSNALKQMKAKYGDEFESIVELMKRVAKAEAAAERARKQVLDAAKDVERNQKRKVFASDKLKDAEFLGQNSTLLIVEGNSAIGAVAQARDYTRYGILGIRGKMINCLSNPDEKIYQNEEIKLLLSAMNIVPGKYNASKLRYGRIGICTDAD